MSDWSDFAADCGISANDPEGIDKLIDMWADDEEDVPLFECWWCGESGNNSRKFIFDANNQWCMECYKEAEEEE